LASNRKELTMKRSLSTALVGLAVIGLAACGDYGKKEEKAAASYASAVEGSGALVGVVVDQKEDRVLAYVCDGKSVAAWFTGTPGDDGSISLTSADGTRLTGRVAGDTLTGSLILPNGGATHTFSAPEVDAPAGLYRSKSQLRGEPAVGGWVVLEDGRQRGAVRTTTGFISWEPDLAKPSKPVTGFISTDTDI
jgi:serine/threonine-protein kinase